MIQSVLNGFSSPVLKQVSSLHFGVNPVYGHDEINKLLENTVLLGGKRLRPLLTYLMTDFFGGELSAADELAKAIEMVHGASLAHDDVIDQATIRRSLPSINIASSNKSAVLAGDYLLAHVIQQLVDFGRIELVAEMSQVIGLLAKGEWLQVKAAENRSYSQDILTEIALCKTASVMSWCCVAPAISFNKGPEIVGKARAFGESLGMAFQLIDDVIDFSKESEKDQLIDLKNNQINAVTYKWLLYNTPEHEAFKGGESIEKLWHDGHLLEACHDVRSRALEYLSHCRALLDQMEELLGQECKIESKNALIAILDYLGDRKQ